MLYTQCQNVYKCALIYNLTVAAIIAEILACADTTQIQF